MNMQLSEAIKADLQAQKNYLLAQNKAAAASLLQAMRARLDTQVSRVSTGSRIQVK